MNVKNRTIFERDNLEVLRRIDTESIDLIYLDPPFNSKKTYSAPIGSEAAGAAFKDTWTLSDIDNAWHGELAHKNQKLYSAIHAAELMHSKSMKSYLIMMAIRLLEMRRILKNTGSIYLHCDPHASHYLKGILDCIFGTGHFRNEIIWGYKTGGTPRSSTSFVRKHDILLFYTKGKKTIFNRLTQKSYAPSLPEPHTPSGKKLGVKRDKIEKYRIVQMRDYWINTGLIPEDDIRKLYRNDKKESVSYPTQKPLALLERIISASSNPGDIVLDPFCGCATTCIAAEKLQRQWIGIDLSAKAVELVKLRLEKDLGITDRKGILGKVIHRTDIPFRSEKLPNYRTHKHELYGKQEGNCIGCDIHFPFKNMTVDHIVPKSKGGTDHADNLQLLCGYCNLSKGSKSQEEFIASQKEKYK